MYDAQHHSTTEPNGRVAEPARLAQVADRAQASKPKLIFFFSPTSGRCRRAEGFLAQALQRRRNHGTFDLLRVSVEERPDLAEKFRIEQVPTICVVENGKLQMTIVAPRGTRELEGQLTTWLH